MEAIINSIVGIVESYRKDSWLNRINNHRIKTWINQFDEEDREFILLELLHLLPKSYITKEIAVETLNDMFDVFKKDFKYESVAEFLDHTSFLRCQPQHKSQGVLLDFLDEILLEKYGKSIADCGKKEGKYWLYIDDVLASGGTCRKDIVTKVTDYGEDKFQESGIKIVCIFFVLHQWGVVNSRYTIGKQLGYELNNDRLKYYRVEEIENNPRIHKYWNPKPKFNHLYPVKNQDGVDFLEFIENAFDRSYDMKNEEYAFRDPNQPSKEEFFSSKENRDRYEKIMLKKGIEIINNIENLNARGLRPLGMTPPAYKTLGTGSHVFTWRNISNTCPLVYWWEANGWYPLFSVQNRGN